LEKYSFGFFWGFLGLGREPPLLAGSGRGSGFRTRQGGRGRTPRVHAGLAHVSTIHRSRSRLSSRVTRQEERGLVRGLGENPPFLQGLFLLDAEGGVARGLEGDAADRTAAKIPRDEGRKDRGGRGSGGEGSEVLLGGGASPLRTPGAVPSTFARARRGRTPVFRSAQLAPDEWTRGFELAGPVSTGRPRDESQASPDERTPGNKPDTSKLTGYEFFGTPARRVFGPVSAARLEPTRRGERRVAMAARDGHDAPDGA